MAERKKEKSFKNHSEIKRKKREDNKIRNRDKTM